MTHEIFDRIDKMLLDLNSVYDKYEILNKDTHGKYRYRQNSIELQISVLDALKNGWDSPLEDWETCYAEDYLERDSN